MLDDGSRGTRGEASSTTDPTLIRNPALISLDEEW
jgi:hypothetical protein